MGHLVKNQDGAHKRGGMVCAINNPNDDRLVG